MASPQDQDAAVSTPPSSRETSSSPPRARAPRRPDMGTGCAALCFHLPRRSKKKQTPLAKLNSDKSVDEQPAAVVDASASASPRVTFLASASLSTWWPSSPGAPGGDVAWRRSSPSVRGGGGGGGACRRALSSSFSYWRRSQQSSSRVMPHGGSASARVSFSFPSSPMSVSSCMSTPKVSHGCQQQ